MNTAENCRKIDLMIIGAQKAGSTALIHYLQEHPQLIGHPHTEMTFFVDDDEYHKGYSHAFRKYFNQIPDPQQRIVAKNVTLSFREYGLARLAAHNPECEIVFILRNPIDRAYSAYQMAVRGGWLDQPFSYLETAIEKHQRNEKDTFYRFILELGIYAPQIETVYQYFPRNKVHIFLYDDLKNQPQEICSKLFERLGVDTRFIPNFDKKYNVGSMPKYQLMTQIIRKLRRATWLKNAVRQLISEKYFITLSKKINDLNKKPMQYTPMSAVDREKLIAFYKPHNAACSRILNRDLNCWNQ